MLSAWNKDVTDELFLFARCPSLRFILNSGKQTLCSLPLQPFQTDYLLDELIPIRTFKNVVKGLEAESIRICYCFLS